jgi:hypothetical protein
MFRASVKAFGQRETTPVGVGGGLGRGLVGGHGADLGKQQQQMMNGTHTQTHTHTHTHKHTLTLTRISTHTHMIMYIYTNTCIHTYV